MITFFLAIWRCDPCALETKGDDDAHMPHHVRTCLNFRQCVMWKKEKTQSVQSPQSERVISSKKKSRRREHHRLVVHAKGIPT